MAQKCYLLTSPEKFRQLPGNGYSSTVYQLNTGDRTWDIQNHIPDWYLPAEIQSCSPSVGISPEKIKLSGWLTEIHTKLLYRTVM